MIGRSQTAAAPKGGLQSSRVTVPLGHGDARRSRALLNRWPQADGRGGGRRRPSGGTGTRWTSTHNAAWRAPRGAASRRRTTRRQNACVRPAVSTLKRWRREIAWRCPRTAAQRPGRSARPGRSKCVRGRSVRRRGPRTPRGAGRSPAGLISPRSIPTSIGTVPRRHHRPKQDALAWASQDASPSRDALHRPGTISSITDAD